MPPVIRVFLLLASLATAVAQPVPLSPIPTDGSAPAPIEVPAPVDEPANVSPPLRQKMDRAHAAWKKDDGASFSPGLVFGRNGKPNLMLITVSNEPEDMKGRRKKAIVTACEFLLEQGAFEDAVVSVVNVDPQNPSVQTIRNYEIKRQRFEAAAKKAGKSENLENALKKARGEKSAIDAVCAELSIE